MAETGKEGPRRNITTNQVALMRAEQWGRFRVHSVWAIASVSGIWVSQYPLQWLSLCAKELAGRDTKISLGVTITLSVVGMAATIAAITGHVKLKRQSQQLIDLRGRCRGLEGRIAEHRAVGKNK